MNYKQKAYTSLWQLAFIAGLSAVSWNTTTHFNEKFHEFYAKDKEETLDNAFKATTAAWITTAGLVYSVVLAGQGVYYLLKDKQELKNKNSTQKNDLEKTLEGEA